MAEASVAARPPAPTTPLPPDESWQWADGGGGWLRMPITNLASPTPVNPSPVTPPPVTRPPKPTTPLPDNEEWQFIGTQWLRVPKTTSTPPVTPPPVTPPPVTPPPVTPPPVTPPVYAPPIIEDLFPAPVAPPPPDIPQPSRFAGANPLIAALRANSPAPARSAEGPSKLNYPWMQNTVPGAPAPIAPPKAPLVPSPKGREPQPNYDLPDDEMWDYMDFGGDFGGEWLRVPNPNRKKPPTTPEPTPTPTPTPERELQPSDPLPDDEKWEYIDFGGEGQWLRVPR